MARAGETVAKQLIEKRNKALLEELDTYYDIDKSADHKKVHELNRAVGAITIEMSAACIEGIGGLDDRMIELTDLINRLWIENRVEQESPATEQESPAVEEKAKAALTLYKGGPELSLVAGAKVIEKVSRYVTRAAVLCFVVYALLVVFGHVDMPRPLQKQIAQAVRVEQ